MSTIHGGQGRIITDGLVLRLDAANPRSYINPDTVWNDLSGNAINAALVNGPAYNSSNGGSIRLDGVDDYITVSSNGFGRFNVQDFTIDMWIKLNSAPTYSPIWSYDYINHVGQPYYAQHVRFGGNSVLYIGWNIAASYVEQSIAVSFTTGAWYNIAVTRKSTGEMAAYVNSVSVWTGTSAGTISYYNQPVWLGKANFTGFGYSPVPSNINYGSTRFYNRYFSAADVRQNYNATRTRFGV